MKLHRPHVPLDVRIQVAQRQLRGCGLIVDRNLDEADDLYLDRLLGLLAIDIQGAGLFAPLELDHDPALTNRKFSQRTMKYTPDANDPRFLVYRSKEAHDIKTRVRGDGAQLSDLALSRKMRRIEKRVKDGKRAKHGGAR